MIIIAVCCLGAGTPDSALAAHAKDAQRQERTPAEELSALPVLFVEIPPTRDVDGPNKRDPQYVDPGNGGGPVPPSNGDPISPWDLLIFAGVAMIPVGTILVLRRQDRKKRERNAGLE